MPATPLITSTANPRIKQAVHLRRRSHRDKTELTVIEGYRETRRALDNGFQLTELFTCKDFFLGSNEPELINIASANGAVHIECTANVFKKISYRDRPDGILAVAPRIKYCLDDIRPGNPPFLLVAEAVEKPGNLGTILRSADAAGADGVIVCDRCTDLNNPNVIRASIGTIFSVPAVEMDGADCISFLRGQGITIAAATPHAEQLYTEADLTVPLAIVMGTEQYGLSKTWLEAADLQLRIPMHGQADSLNVATATTILLFETVRQRSALS